MPSPQQILQRENQIAASAPSTMPTPVPRQPSQAQTELASLIALLTPTALFNMENQRVNATTNIIPLPANQPYIIPNKYPCTIRIYVTFADLGTLTIQRYFNGGAATSETLNAALGSLLANNAYIFSTMMDKGDGINLQYSVNSTALKLSLWEIDSVFI